MYLHYISNEMLVFIPSRYILPKHDLCWADSRLSIVQDIFGCSPYTELRTSDRFPRKWKQNCCRVFISFFKLTWPKQKVFFVTLTKRLEKTHTIHGERHINTVIVFCCGTGNVLIFSTSVNELTWWFEGDINGLQSNRTENNNTSSWYL